MAQEPFAGTPGANCAAGAPGCTFHCAEGWGFSYDGVESFEEMTIPCDTRHCGPFGECHSPTPPKCIDLRDGPRELNYPLCIE